MGKKNLNARSGTTKPGLQYEKIVAAIHRYFAGDLNVTENENIVGKSGRTRQIDVALRTNIAGYNLLIVIECKDYKRRIGIAKVDELIGKMDDVGADKGILVSDSGFDRGALERAKNYGRIETVSVIDTDNIKLKMRLFVPVSYKDIVFSQKCDFKFVFLDKRIYPEIPEAECHAIRKEKLELISADEFRHCIRSAYEWVWENGSNMKAGSHEFKYDFVKNGHLLISFTATFTSTHRVFFKKDYQLQGRGIYNHGNSQVNQPDEMKININIEEIRGSWTEVPHDFEFPQGTVDLGGLIFVGTEAIPSLVEQQIELFKKQYDVFLE